MGSRFLAAALALATSTAGCARSSCVEAPGSSDASAAEDAAREDDASTCAVVAAHAYLVELPLDTAPTPVCGSGLAPFGVDLYDANGRWLRGLAPHCVPGTSFIDLGPVAPGHYLLSIMDTGAVAAGGELLGDPACPSPTLGTCAPLILEMPACGPSAVPFFVDCSPATTDCRGGA